MGENIRSRNLNGERISIDLDGTLAASIEKALELINKDLGKSLSIEDIDVYSVDKSKLHVKNGIDNQTFMEYINLAWSRHHSEIKPLADGELLIKVHSMIPIDIVTAQPIALRDYTLSWLKVSYPKINLKLVNVENTSSKVNTGHSRYIDDHPRMAQRIIEANPETGAHPRPILHLIDTPYTRNAIKAVPGRIELVRDVNHALQRIIDDVQADD